MEAESAQNESVFKYLQISPVRWKDLPAIVDLASGQLVPTAHRGPQDNPEGGCRQWWNTDDSLRHINPDLAGYDMTIQIHSGCVPSAPSYTSPVNAAPTRVHSVGSAYARYLRHRADTFEAELTASDEAMEALVLAETDALLAVAAAPARSVEEFALKLQLLQGEIEAHDAGKTASVLAACLVADLRNI